MSCDQQPALALARRGQEIALSADVLKDPFVLVVSDLDEPDWDGETDVRRRSVLGEET